MVQTLPESVRAMNNASWELVRGPNRPMADYRRGLRLAEAAYRLAPDNVSLLNTVGVARYRVGLDQQALDDLKRSDDLNKHRRPEDLAFLAMAHHRLGHRDEARRWLDRLRACQPSTDPNQSWDEPGVRLLRSEAEALILFDPAFPADPFAR